MLGIVKEIDGQKKIVPLTTDTGTGAPVGTLISQYKKVPMSGYLYCDGSTFDENDYPALYMYLGTNVLPDYRECVMVGAEQNTTDTIETHDVYGEGEFKDDQMQRITGSFESADRSRSPNTSGAFSVSKSTESWFALDTVATNSSLVSFDSANIARSGDTNTTHGKQKAVYVYIKATSGLAENQQENVLNDVKGYVDNSNSYSTDEVKTGGKWIDGKPIYRKTLVFTNITLTRNDTTLIGNTDIPINKIIKTEETMFTVTGLAGSTYKAIYIDSIGDIYAFQNISDTITGWTIYFTIEYTKTTD